MDRGLAEHLLGAAQGRPVLNRRARQGAFTLVEVMVAIAIVAMVLAFAGPSAKTWIQNTQLRNAAEAILGGVQQARIEALKRNTTVAFQLTDPASTAFQVCFYDPTTQDCSTAQPAIATRAASEGSPNAGVGIDFTASNPTTAIAPGSNLPALVAFDSFGRVATTSPLNIARIDVRNLVAGSRERRLEIFIAPGGQIRMCDPALDKTVNPQGCQ
jgi:type IV fimbrial biogenesis protein FimT